MSKKIIVANWKMNPSSLKEAESLFTKISKKNNFKKIEIVICPPYLYLCKLKKFSRKIVLGAQNLFYEERGAFTGEISAEMLSNIGVKFVIIGHSERRKLGESNKDVNKKIKAALFFGIKPILCVGETERDENHEYFNFVKNQIEESLNGIHKDLIQKIIIAYEPVWALSTTQNRKDSNPDDSREMTVFIKKVLIDKFGTKIKMPKILYGGSVDVKNCCSFLKDGGVDGTLVGGASLNSEKFLEILNIAENTL
ncbi:MAG TPA: triose-phosphate isomerase [Candidatus Paceibacterota bacterium]|nr:triose-phosphate isomerase [Candidatus Paceibacterota bacterium]HPT18059.1 triose-phosphate isomerase [Candidatus Paceibacterota bacterium]